MQHVTSPLACGVQIYCLPPYQSLIYIFEDDTNVLSNPRRGCLLQSSHAQPPPLATKLTWLAEAVLLLLREVLRPGSTWG